MDFFKIELNKLLEKSNKNMTNINNEKALKHIYTNHYNLLEDIVLNLNNLSISFDKLEIEINNANNIENNENTLNKVKEDEIQNQILNKFKPFIISEYLKHI